MLDLTTLTKALGELDEEKVLFMLNAFATGNPTKEEASEAIEACQKGMAIVGDQFETGDYYVGDLMFAGEVLSEAIKILEPIIGSDSSDKLGKIVLGTVHEDLHDIGKNIFKSMAEASGFEVYDLGIDVPVSTFVEKVREVAGDSWTERSPHSGN